MKRVATISGTGVKVTIEVNPKKGELSRDEVERSLGEIADGCMKAVAGATYVGTRISRLKVKGL